MHPRLGLSLPTLSLVALAAFLLCAAPGCANRNAEYARSATIERHLDSYVIPKPIDEVWETARSPGGARDQLMWNGEMYAWSQTAPWKMRTAPKTVRDKGPGPDRQDVTTWFECEAIRSSGGAQVHYIEWTLTRSYRGTTELGTKRRSKRRVDLELEVVKHFDPAAGQKIEVAAELAAQNAN